RAAQLAADKAHGFGDHVVTEGQTITGDGNTALRLQTRAVSGIIDSALPIDIGVTSGGTMLHSAVSLNISSIPTAGTLSAAMLNADGSYTLAAPDLSGLTFSPPPHWSGKTTLIVKVSTPTGDGPGVTGEVPVVVGGGVVAPRLTVHAAA